MVELAGGVENVGVYEGQLLDGCRQGDQQAWREMVGQYTPLVWTVARSLGLRPADCEDVCQSTWTQLVRSIDTIAQPDRLSTWIVTVARREAIKHLRSCAGQVPVAVVEPAEERCAASGPEDTVVARLDGRRALAALRALPSHQRQLIELLISEPAPTYDQISVRLSIPRGSIGPTRGRILAAMQVYLEADHHALAVLARKESA